ncbi:T9SS type A sorting domain-containing protein [candidate division KSB1 bacterium]|nr:T9SS type A sorting domain-containing protein [candidate division KSB1 bacterium]RQW04096.1 MAG: T9SS C-terminal target domain-containing protein [candidate division KSB1 bacterium]
MHRHSIFIAIFFLSLIKISFSQELAGVLRADTTLTAALSPWRITADVVVPASVTLKIEPGCTLYFHDNAGLQIQSGRLVALGEQENRITLTRRPETSDHWNGIEFYATLQENMLCYADMQYGDNLGQIIDIHRAQVVLDHCTWNSTDRTIVEVYHPAAIIQHCIFPSVDEVEVIHGEYLQDEEYLILIGNTFGAPLGYNDVIDFTDCKLPGPILQVYDNHFLGGSDDGLDLDGADAYIEGNTFMNFHKGHDGSSTSNAIATGLRNGKTSDIVVVRNLFYDNDHAVLLKEDCSMQAEHNTFVKSDSGVINFSEWPDRDVDPGKGATFSGNIFWDYGLAFRNQFSQPGERDPVISFSYGIIDASQHALGVQNSDQDPQFIGGRDFHLKPTSPAIGAGPNGLDIGAYVPAGASISGEPSDTTTQTNATLTIGGPGIVSYKFVLNDPHAQWSEERSIVVEPSIVLEDLLPDQFHTVYVKGKSVVGWQGNPDYAVSKTWFITDSPAPVHMAAASLPVAYRLYDAYPNPCNENTIIQFDLPAQQRVRIDIYDALGRSVAVLKDENMPAGTFRIKVNGQEWPTGVYYYQMIAGDFKQAKRLILVH